MTDTAAAAAGGGATTPLAGRHSIAWSVVAVLVAVLCGVLTYVVRTEDGVDAEVSLVAESGGRISGPDRALAAGAGLRAEPDVVAPPDQVDDVVVSVRPGAGILDLRVRASTAAVASSHATALVELVEAASRDEEVRILETQIEELEIALAALDPDSREAARVQGQIEVRRGQLAVLTGLMRRAGPVTTRDAPASPLRDGVVVAVVVGLGLAVAVPRLVEPGT